MFPDIRARPAFSCMGLRPIAGAHWRRGAIREALDKGDKAKAS
jgi:hypothetical protein